MQSAALLMAATISASRTVNTFLPPCDAKLGIFTTPLINYLLRNALDAPTVHVITCGLLAGGVSSASTELIYANRKPFLSVQIEANGRTQYHTMPLLYSYNLSLYLFLVLSGLTFWCYFLVTLLASTQPAPRFVLMASSQDGEQAPLLPATHYVDNAREAAVGSAPTSRPTIIVKCLLLLVFVGIGKTLIIGPINHIQEDVLCHNSSMNNLKVLDNSSCRHDELSLLQSWTAASENIMSFLTAAPYGMAADIYGRKRILQFSIAGTILAQAFDVLICAYIYTPRYIRTRLN